MKSSEDSDQTTAEGGKPNRTAEGKRKKKRRRMCGARSRNSPIHCAPDVENRSSTSEDSDLEEA